MNIIFDTLNIYYLPQYIPISIALKQAGHNCTFVCYQSKNDEQQFSSILKQVNCPVKWVNDEAQATNYYLQAKADWIFFGNAFNELSKIHQVSKTVQLGHGVGPKPSYYHKSRTPMTVRFIEGTKRLEKIKELYPKDNFVQVGFSKLDPLFNGTETGFNLTALGLDPTKKTILYAPTFNPSSLERFPNDWPQDFADYNILIKPHTFTYTRQQYHKQRKKLAAWEKFNNTYVAKPEDISLLPFMANADILLSEASSTLFEFVALDKPVIVCDFYQLKWSYRGIFKYRFEKRFGKDNVIYQDIGCHVKSYKSLKHAVHDELSNPKTYQENRKTYTHEHIGPTDGKTSSRIVAYLEQFTE
ncbi:CDP-glycerol glycerophosphotransferase family protein [Catenovulum sp. 2E275]|uniref:CDP-glycerol glycerophosphotransferase family protein n=1 Tax=Catenovulum sp. 2E275 TaxID=2980497 RepID=UPI0021CF231C|nr:CDP-glycerol glycerophosphotransferase family protein [Catenovulum sp. 2E275]MCU4674234.1 CDP-glycerol glycerophosphotransferase family protein [Catenovulum sp. 2E275]